MSITATDLQRISELDLKQLIENEVAEGLMVEYKRDLYGPSDKREALKDISSFSNTAGGHIIIGMEEAAGLPINLVGVEGDLDKEIQRLENLLRDCIEPR